MAVTTTVEAAVATVTIDNPSTRNAVDGPTATRLADAMRAVDVDAAVSVIVLTGAGGTFCSGADLSAVAEPGMPRAPRVDPEGDGPLGITRMVLSKPVIAAIEGHAVAGGLELALWCDLRVVAAGAVLGVFCRRFGVPLVDGGTVRLPRIVGMGRALDLILTGRPVRADEALAMGLATSVVPDGQARLAAVGLAHRLSALPQVCMRGDRLSAHESWGLDDHAALRNEVTRGMRVLASGEAADGARRFRDGAGRHGDEREHPA